MSSNPNPSPNQSTFTHDKTIPPHPTNEPIPRSSNIPSHRPASMRVSVEDVPDEDIMLHKRIVRDQRAAGDFDRDDNEWLDDDERGA